MTSTAGTSEPNYSRVLELALAAAFRTLERLSSIAVPERLATVFRQKDGGIESDLFPFYAYRAGPAWDAIHAIWDSDETLALTDYLWDHVSFRRAFIDPNGDARIWARAAFGNLIHMPLLDALRRYAVHKAVVGERPTAWAVEPSYLEEAVRSRVLQIEEVRSKRETFTAYSPLATLDLPESFDVAFGQGIRIRRWSVFDQLVFMTEYGDEYLWADFNSPLLSTSIAEVTVTATGPTEQTTAVRMVADKLDLLKWALFVATDSDKVVGEGKTLLLTRTGHVHARLQRDERMSWAQPAINGETVERCRRLIADFADARMKYDDFERGLWHFGRSAVAVLNRDALLEAAIGLDAVLVPGGPESRYRFCLHGSVVIGKDAQSSSEVHRNLQDIYSKRSAAAHGSISKQYEPWTQLGRIYLARVLAELVQRFKEGVLPAEKDLSSSVQQFVFQRATRDT